jgi:all-beta uncharacterized protein/BACON domain-containing protein
MRARLFAALLVPVLAAACSAGSNSIEVTAPSAVKCQVTVSNATTGSVPAGGTTSTVAVDTTRDCTWSASADVPWIALTPPTTGQGSGTVGYRVTANGEAVQRRGVIDVNNSRIDLVQDAAPCRFTVTPATAAVAAAGTNLTVTIETLNGCTWRASSPVNWVVVTSSPTGSRSGSVTLAVAVNDGAARSTSVTIAGQAVTINQSAATESPSPTLPTPPTPPSPAPPPPPAACTYALDSASQRVDHDGATIGVSVSAGADCAWTATSHDSWIAVAAGATGSGNGVVSLRVSGNPGASRIGTVTIAGKTFTVEQDAASCNYALGGSSQSVPFDGGSGSVSVSAGGACRWTASSNASWITITSGTSGTGNGTVAFTVAGNTGGERSGTLTIAGRTFTVRQAAAPPPPCTFSIAPGSQNVGESGGPGAVTVTASAGTCAWSATSNAPWITITNGATGTGDGRVEYTVAANTGPARSGTVTIAGQTLTVTQAAAPPPCSWTVAPTLQNVPDTGGTLTAGVTASAPTCAWTAVANDPWIAITAGSSGTGNGTVTFTVSVNTGTARTGTLTIAGQTFTVAQAAPPPPPCSFTIAPPGASLPAEGGSGAVTITASAPGCTWTAVSPDSWVVFTSPAAGTGSGSIGFSVAANAGPARTSTLTIAGQPFTISQAAPPAMP